MRESPHYWFPAKRHGWGWNLPRTWQGWLVLAGYAATLVILHLVLPPTAGRGAFLLGAGLATLALLTIFWLKGEPPGSRQGG